MKTYIDKLNELYKVIYEFNKFSLTLFKCLLRSSLSKSKFIKVNLLNINFNKAMIKQRINDQKSKYCSGTSLFFENRF